MKEILIFILKRALWSLAPALLGAYCVKRAFYGSGAVPEVASWMLFACAMLIVIAIQLSFPVAGIIGDWFSRIYMPAANGIPPVSYLLADLYEKEHRWELSMGEFQKIIHYHPDELPAHLGRLRVAIHGFEDSEAAKKFLQASLHKLHDQKSQLALRMEFEKLLAEDES